MTDDRSSIIDRIKKLLAMTTEAGCSQAEAIQAALMAQRLIAEHDVQSSELSEKAGESVTQLGCNPTLRYLRWGIKLANIIAENFRCRSYMQAQEKRSAFPVFVGYENDANAAALVFHRLYEVGKSLANEKRAEARKECPYDWFKKRAAKIAYDSFTYGFVEGVSCELEKQSQALMLKTPLAVNDFYEAISQDFIQESKSSQMYIDNDVYGEGQIAGRDAIRAGQVGQADYRTLLNAAS